MNRWDELENIRSKMVTKHYQDTALLESIETNLCAINMSLSILKPRHQCIHPSYLSLQQKQQEHQRQYDELFGVIVTDMKELFKIMLIINKGRADD